MKNKLGQVEEITDTAKAIVTVPDGIGLREWIGKIEYAWEEESEDDLKYSHVREIFSDYVIVARGYGDSARLHKVNFTIESDGEIEFDTENIQEVELKTEWVTKSLDILPREHKFAIKALGDDRIGGYAVLWGGEDMKDLHGEYFTPETDELTTVFKAMGALPWLFHHAIDDKLKTSVIALVDKMEPDDIGLWFEAKIREHQLYKDYVEPLVKKKILFSSSGTFPGAKRVDVYGKLLRWPIAEMTGTVSPAQAEFLQLPIGEIKAHYKSIGINDEDLTKLDALDNQTNQSEEGTQIDTEVETESLDTVNVDDEVNTDAEKRELDNLSLDLEKLELELVLL